VYGTGVGLTDRSASFQFSTQEVESQADSRIICWHWGDLSLIQFAVFDTQEGKRSAENVLTIGADFQGHSVRVHQQKYTREDVR